MRLLRSCHMSLTITMRMSFVINLSNSSSLKPSSQKECVLGAGLS